MKMNTQKLSTLAVLVFSVSLFISWDCEAIIPAKPHPISNTRSTTSINQAALENHNENVEQAEKFTQAVDHVNTAVVPAVVELLNDTPTNADIKQIQLYFFHSKLLATFLIYALFTYHF
ncbi:unnamed protein product [Amaranthus hypochondriacus]